MWLQFNDKGFKPLSIVLKVVIHIIKKRILVLLAGLAIMLLLMGAGVDPAESAIEEAAASDSAAALDVLQTDVQEETETKSYFLFVDGAPADVKYTFYEGSTYVSVVEFSKLMAPEANITWTGDSVIVNTEKLTLTAKVGVDYVVANGRYLYLEDGVEFYDNSAMLPVVLMAKAFDAQLVWNGETGTVNITRGSGALEPAEVFYKGEDLYWLSRIINAESGNQSMTGKIAVGNVIMNRVESRLFPNSIYGVIFQKNQFSPAKSGSINKAPSEESVIAAKLVLDGAEVIEHVLYFNQQGLNCWAARNKTFVMTIGNHSFYK